mgnify:CR=1 FL=1
MASLISIDNLTKTYEGGFQALKGVSMEIEKGEIIALLGPNGAGKTTMISIICGISRATSGTVTVEGDDIVRDYRKTRSRIGLVPQELTTDQFETVIATVSYSRGLFGKPAKPEHIEWVLRELSLWEKRDEKVGTLSGGMKRRLLIAKALSHEPDVLFLDEPSAGVDVSLRKDMWNTVRKLRESGVTIILTTHYIEEAEEMADRIAVINRGEIIVVEEKAELMRKLGQKDITLTLAKPIEAIPDSVSDYDLTLSDDGSRLTYSFMTTNERTGITRLLTTLADEGIRFSDVDTRQSSLEDIFVSLVEESA